MSERIVIGESGLYGTPITAKAVHVEELPASAGLRWRYDWNHFVLEHWYNGWNEVPCVVSDTPEK